MNSHILNIVHISDIHIKETNNEHIQQQVPHLAETICSRCCAGRTLLVITGDIAYSGKEPEYQLANCFLDALIESIKNDIHDLQIAVIPGNHDVNISHSSLRKSALLGIHASPPPNDTQLLELAGAQGDFFAFSRRTDTLLEPWDSRHSTSKTFTCGSHHIQITAVNTALSSDINEEPGSLYLHPPLLPARGTAADINIVLLHHPLHWLHESIRRLVSDWIGNNAEVVLTGHEHQLDEFKIYRQEYPATVFIAAQALWDPKVAKEGFQIITIDSTERKCTTFVYEKTSHGYQKSGELSRALASATDRQHGIRQSESYAKSLEQLNVGVQHKSGKQVTHSSIFVYPSLRAIERTSAKNALDNTSFVDGENLPDIITDEHRILIVGEEYSGKTFLVRQLVKDFRARAMFPIVLDTRLLDRKALKDAVDSCILTQYDIDSTELYFRQPKSERILIVEDVDLHRDAHIGL